MIQIRKTKDPEKKSEFPVVAMLWPGIGIAVGIACDTALKSIGWGITLGAIFGGVLLVVHLLAARTKKPGNQSSMTNRADGYSGDQHI